MRGDLNPALSSYSLGFYPQCHTGFHLGLPFPLPHSSPHACLIRVVGEKVWGTAQCPQHSRNFPDLYGVFHTDWGNYSYGYHDVTSGYSSRSDITASVTLLRLHSHLTHSDLLGEGIFLGCCLFISLFWAELDGGTEGESLPIILQGTWAQPAGDFSHRSGFSQA